MDYPSSLVPAFFGYSTRLLRRCLLDSPTFESGVIRAILPRDAENERRPSRNTRVRSLLIWRRSGILKKLSRRATRVYFGAEHLGPRLASRDFNFARLAAARSSLAFLLLIATTARPSRVLLLCVPLRHDTVARSATWFFLFLQAKDSASRSFSLVFPRPRNERSILDNDKFSFCASCASFCGSLPSCLLVALSRTLPFPTKLLVISVHSPFPVISLSSRATSTEISHCCLFATHFRDFFSESYTVAAASIHLLIHKDEYLPFFFF